LSTPPSSRRTGRCPPRRTSWPGAATRCTPRSAPACWWDRGGCWPPGRGAPGSAASRSGNGDAGRAARPEREEAGSPNVIGAVALLAAIGVLEDIGWSALISHDRRIAAALRRGLAAIPGVRLLGPGPGTETLPVAAFTIDGVPDALVAARLAAEDAIGVRHGDFQARPCLTRLLGLGPAEARSQAGAGRRGAAPGAVRASAGINTSEQDVARLLSAVARLAAGDPPVGYRRDPATGEFYPAATGGRACQGHGPKREQARRNPLRAQTDRPKAPPT
jgi:Aminotransferase class-V